MPESDDAQAARQFTVFDKQALQALQRMAGDSTFIQEVIDCYLDESAMQIRALQTSVQQGDAALFRRSVHSLKSNSASIGAIALATVCATLEAVDLTAPTLHSAILDQLEVEYERVQIFLAQERQHYLTHKP